MYGSQLPVKKKRFYELSDWRMTAAEWEVFYFMGKFCEITGLWAGMRMMKAVNGSKRHVGEQSRHRQRDIFFYGILGGNGMEKSNKQSTVMKRKTLAKVTAKLLCTVMAFVFLVLIISTAGMAGKGLLSGTFNNLQTIAQSNGVQIQEYMNICQTTAKGLVSHIEFLTAEERSLASSDTKMISLERSEVYGDLDLNSIKKQLEDYLIATAKNAVANNTAVIGIGIMFEPYQFTSARESYALYFTEENGEVTVSDVGAYEEFSANDYYQIAVGKTDTIFTEPYSYRDMWMITGATPIIVDGEMIGVINIDVSMSVFDSLNLSNENFPSLTTSIVSNDGIINFDSGNADNISKNISEVTFADSEDMNTVLNNMQTGKSFRTKYFSKSANTNVYGNYYPLQAGSETWAAVTEASSRDVLKSTFLTIAILIALCIVSLIIIAYITVKTLRRKLAPIQDIVDAANSITSGNLDIGLSVDSDDEIGVLADAFMETSRSLKNMIGDISQVLEGISHNDYTVDTQIIYNGDFIKIKESFMNILQNLNNAMQDIRVSSEQVSIGADQMASTAQSLAADAAEQAVSIDKLGESIKEVTATVETNAEHAEQASSLVLSVGNEVEQSNKKMEQMISAIAEITETSKRIELIIQNIESIASQTNLLSLNASIEAARAGEAGKGFAVVADEIRELASQSAGAAQNTRKLIEESIRAVENGTAIASETENSMLSLVEQIRRIITTIENIAVASNEQKDAIREVESSVAQISDVVQNNSGSAEESSATSEELKAQAETLSALLAGFTLKD